MFYWVVHDVKYLPNQTRDRYLTVNEITEKIIKIRCKQPKCAAIKTAANSHMEPHVLIREKSNFIPVKS